MNEPAKHPDDEMKLAELETRSGFPARTIRLYITQGLLPGPLRAGRNAAYGPEHLSTLERIRGFQRDGLTLSQIRRVLAGPRDDSAPPAAIPCWEYEVAPDVVVTVRGQVPAWRLRLIQGALLEMRQRLNSEESSGEE